jgi:ubiquinone biosynthesis protein UbiJ
VKTGDRVLVVGLTQQQLSLIAEFDADSFEPQSEPEPASEDTAPAAASFLAELRATSERKRSVAEEDDLEALRGDIQRLQRYVQESAREPRE